jgi:protein-S-isoprenylcysteine O-methyltransferase Ste14
MKSLELKIPPPIVTLIVGFLMWRVSLLDPAVDPPALARFWIAPALALIGIAFTASGAIAFRRAKTTTNPTKPESSSSLVSSGPYRITRNPMYVGLALILAAWAAFLWSAWTIAGPLIFIAYIRRFQIAPEERALADLFGPQYGEYKARVRRWL